MVCLCFVCVCVEGGEVVMSVLFCEGVHMVWVGVCFSVVLL